MARREDVFHTQVVLDVAAALDGTFFDTDFEFAKQSLVGLAHDVDQYVQSAAVGHADNYFAEAGIGGVADDRVENWDGALATFKTEPLGAGVLAIEETLERFSSIKPGENMTFFVVFRGAVDAFDGSLYPAFLFGVLDMHVVDACGAAVGIAHLAQDVAQDHLARSGLAGIGVIGVEELAVEVPHRESVGLGIDVDVGIGLAQTQRIEVGDQVATNSVHVDALVDGDLFGHRLVAATRGAIWVEVDGLVRNADGLEDLVVEVVFSDQQAVNGPQEFA